ncbi:hypothetical protein V5O48_012795 [Marasmius crinis-equi]|uniref:Uncharacterized protein n=1 Tax=Marasmius crinis-equi TaxID=585013 RepID=A0ABR3F1T2_9AGAR
MRGLLVFAYLVVVSTSALGAALPTLSSTAANMHGALAGNKDLEAGARQGEWDIFCGIAPEFPLCPKTQGVTPTEDQESQTADGADKREEALQARQLDLSSISDQITKDFEELVALV